MAQRPTIVDTADVLPERNLEILAREGDLLAAMPVEALDAPVPTVDGWNLEKVLRHTGRTHQWVTALLGAEPGADLDQIARNLPGLPKGPDCLPAYRHELDALLAAFAEHDFGEPVRTFAGSGTVAFWVRRQAHEVAVHRIDAADAVYSAGGPTPDPLTVDGSADGIDEWARVFLASRWPSLDRDATDGLTGRSVHIHGTDEPSPGEGVEWLIEFEPSGVEVAATHAKGDVALRGRAEDLFLVCWRRRPLDSVDVVGNASVASRLVDVARF